MSTILLTYAIVLRLFSRASTDNLQNHPAWMKLDAFECGMSAADRIIGGYNAGLGQLPWIVRLGYSSNVTDVEWMCGGALLTDRHVITAAHCLMDLEDDIKLSAVRVGEYNTITNPDCLLNVCAPKVQDRKPMIITKHPSFNNPYFQNDIAIIKLDTPVVLHDYASPICLPRTAEQQAQLVNGELLMVAGWGKMNMTTEEYAHILQVVMIPVTKPEVCKMFGKRYEPNKAQICAGAQQNKDACGGDSGGPVMKVFDTPEGPLSYLLGVVSFGPMACGIRKPGVYTSTVYFLKWILDNIM